jgi:hypothetical protein
MWPKISYISDKKIALLENGSLPVVTLKPFVHNGKHQIGIFYGQGQGNAVVAKIVGVAQELLQEVQAEGMVV